MKLQRPLTFFAGLGIICALLAVDQWVFMTWLKTAHLTWYLANGLLIGLVSSVASLAWGGMEMHTGLISSHPFDYIGSSLQLVGLPIFVLGTGLKSDGGDRRGIAIFDLVLAILFVLALVLIMVAWLVVVAPLQYFIFLICGAPARYLSQSKRQPIAQFKGTRLVVNEISSDEKVPEGWWSTSISQKPIAVTSLFASLFFLVIRPLLS